MPDYLTLADVPKSAPAAANPVAFTAPAVAWQNTPWAELVASVGANGAVLLEVIWAGISSNSPATSWEVDIGVGAAGAEQVICTMKVCAYAGAGNDGNPHSINSLPAAIDAIPANARLAARMRGGRTTATTCGYVAVVYLDKPVAGQLTTTTKPMKVCPPSLTPTGLAAGNDWEWSAWQELEDAAPADWMLAPPRLFDNSVNDTLGAHELEIGIGAAGAEAAVLRVRGGGTCGSAGYVGVVAYTPIRLVHAVIPSGSRVAVRVRGRLDPGEAYLRVWLHYFEGTAL